jgi:hypothetical protein
MKIGGSSVWALCALLAACGGSGTSTTASTSLPANTAIGAVAAGMASGSKISSAQSGSAPGKNTGTGASSTQGTTTVHGTIVNPSPTGTTTQTSGTTTQQTVGTNGQVGAAENGNFASLTQNSPGLCAAGSTANFTATKTGWTWACLGSNGGTTDNSGSANNTLTNSLALAQMVKFSGCTFVGLIGTDNTGTEVSGRRIAGTQLTWFNDYVSLIARSNCNYLGRAISTWESPPNFPAIAANMAAFQQQMSQLQQSSSVPQTYVFGEYVAERVSLTASYYYDWENRYFDFSQMCGAAPAPGAVECMASYNQPEYVKYVTFMITKSIDLGLQVYLFGDATNTDSRGTVTSSNLVKVMNQMRSYAAAKGMSVLFIAQNPSTFGGPAYVNTFDLIQGGAYINDNGTIPDTPIVSNKGAGNSAPPRLWMVTNKQGQPYYNFQKLVIEYDWFSHPLDDSSEMACLAIQSQSYLNAVKALSQSNCPMGTLTRTALPATTAIYESLRSMGVGFWRPGRQPIAFPPYIYTPMNAQLAQGTPYQVNFNEEGILALGSGQ